MQSLSSLAPEKAAQIQLVLCDIDDTVTTHGALTARAYAAMESLQQAGIEVIPITGRPAGWCDHIARMWPVSAIVGENGAFFMRYDRAQRRMHQHFWTDPQTQQNNRHKLDQLAQTILREVPGCALASDQPYRIADLAVDFCEDVEPLGEADIDRIVNLFEEVGAQAKVSSIHVNGWFGDYDKLSMTKTLLEQYWPELVDRIDETALFIGDSANDAPMFGFFPISVGVANVRDQLHRIATPPKFICSQYSGDGFVEMAQTLLQHRNQSK